MVAPRNANPHSQLLRQQASQNQSSKHFECCQRSEHRIIALNTGACAVPEGEAHPAAPRDHPGHAASHANGFGAE
jgi:hypothetical protein